MISDNFDTQNHIADTLGFFDPKPNDKDLREQLLEVAYKLQKMLKKIPIENLPHYKVEPLDPSVVKGMDDMIKRCWGIGGESDE
jgi:hypothetical protein